MHGFKGGYATGELVIRSRPMLHEMINVQVLDGKIGAPESTSSDGKDDRVFASALAVKAWIDWLRPSLIAENRIFSKVTEDEIRADTEEGRSANMVESIVTNFFKTKEI